MNGEQSSMEEKPSEGSPQMGQDDMAEKKGMVVGMCICKNCPSWADCSAEQESDEDKRTKGGFCFPTLGKSGCIADEKGCICGTCPVTPKMGLTHSYYCTKGSDKEQLGSDNQGASEGTSSMEGSGEQNQD
jgi:hypothetical protein